MTIYQQCLLIEKKLQILHAEMLLIDFLDSDANKKISSLEKKMQKNIIKILELEKLQASGDKT
jgi:hypothetical protein